MMVQTSTLLVTLLACLLASGLCDSYYSVNFGCGPCSSTSNCNNNLCLKMTGDLSSEVCYGASSCLFTGTQTAKIGRCNMDALGSACATNLCLQSASVNMCYNNGGGYCLDGIRVDQTCSNRVFSVTISGGGLTPTTTSLDMSQYINQCPFTSAIVEYSTCAGDIYGGSCTCCATFSYSGIANGGMGNCVPNTSSVYLLKASVPAGEEMLKLFGLLLFVVMTLVS